VFAFRFFAKHTFISAYVVLCKNRVVKFKGLIILGLKGLDQCLLLLDDGCISYGAQ
jgi:hypothetical protein